ncbi:HYR domain-containing protein, partial [Flavobacteriales bacterium]|nr:HYR domain-containing protein [Flavobacteriales bacterium]
GLYYENDFETSVGSEWSTTTTRLYNGGTVLGEFGNSSATLNLTGLPSHDSIRVEFDLYIADTWDGNGGGPDTWNLTMGGTNVINATFAACCTGSNGGQSYPDNIPASNNAETGATTTGLPDFFGSGDGTDLYEIIRAVETSSGTYAIQFSATGLQSLSDESWGIDNVKIYLYSSNVFDDILWTTGETTETITVSPTETTSYSVTVDNGFSLCLDEVDVEVLNAQITQNDTTICAGNTVQLSVDQPGLSQYLNPNIDYGSVSDIEGNDYATVTIGNQVWMAENLRTATYSNGDPIPQVQGAISWGATNNGAWCVKTAPNWEATYGKFYNHKAVRETRNVCPSGWHVPFISEWDTLITVLGDPIELGGELKNTDTLLWDSPNVGASNSSGFSGLPAGLRSGFFGSVNFSGEGSDANWWTADVPTSSGSNPKYKRLRSSDAVLDQLGRLGRSGLSVRCIKDDTTSQAYNAIQYLWSNGSTQAGISVSPTETTTYTVTITNGITTCMDSVIITVLPLSTDTLQEIECVSYTWAQTGLTYNNSGFYSDTVSVATGCDSIYVLELTIQNQPPIITCLPDIDAQTSNDGSGDCTTTVVISDPGVSDDCDVPTITAQINGSIINPNTYAFPVGITEIEWIATDNAGNADTCYQEITITDDEYPEVVTCPLGVQVDNDPGDCGAIVTFSDAVFSDNCTGLQSNLTNGL